MTESVHNNIYKLETGKWERVGDLTVSINMCLSINFQIVHIEHGVCVCVRQDRKIKFLLTLQITWRKTF